jgi:membrane protease YdiL (CAAX protease family)
MLLAARAALALAALLAAAMGALGALSLAGRGHVLAALALATSVAGLAALLLAGAAAPRRMAQLARAPGLARPAGLAGFAVVAITLFYVFGFGALVDTAETLEDLATHGGGLSQAFEVSRGELLASLLVNFALFTVPVALWAVAAERLRGKEVPAWLGLRRAGARGSLLWAAMAVLLVFWFLIAAGLVLHALGQGEVANERAEAIGRSLDVPTALLVAALTGVGEEVFFRGFLLKKLGNLPQAVLFGLAHLNYLQALEVGVTAALGYMFGRAVQRTGNLWGPVVGHAAFNAVSLLIILFKAGGAFPALS